MDEAVQAYITPRLLFPPQVCADVSFHLLRCGGATLVRTSPHGRLSSRWCFQSVCLCVGQRGEGGMMD